MIISTVGELRALIAGLDDEMPVRGMEDEVPVMLVCDYSDIPDGCPKPPPTLIVECGSIDAIDADVIRRFVNGQG